MSHQIENNNDEKNDQSDEEETEDEEYDTVEEDQDNEEKDYSDGGDMDVSYSAPSHDIHPSLKHSLDQFAKNPRKRIQNLMNFIKAHGPNDISWDIKGLVSVKGQKLKGSNIIDLAREVTVIRPKKTLYPSQPPPGFDHFSRVLKTLNIPRSLVGNKARISEIFKTPVVTPRQVGKRNKRKNAFSPYGYSPEKQIGKFLLEDF